MAQVNNFHGMMTTNKEFFKQACRWKDSTSIYTAAEWWSAFQEVIIREYWSLNSSGYIVKASWK